MTRDYRKLQVFERADALIAPVYQATAAFPAEERFGLQSQIRRAALSVSTNIVEGSTRATQGEYVQFLHISLGSATEARYLLEVADRLGFIPSDTRAQLDLPYTELIKGLQNLITALQTASPNRAARSPKPGA